MRGQARPLITLVVLAFALAAPGALAQEYTKGSIYVERPWSRATPPGAAVGAGYVVIENRGPEPDRLVSVSAEIATRAEMHEMAVVDDIMRMRPLPAGIEIAPGMTAKFEPGGLHFMFLGLQRPLEEGDRFKAELTFERAGTLEVEFVVEALGAGGGHRHQERHTH